MSSAARCLMLLLLLLAPTSYHLRGQEASTRWQDTPTTWQDRERNAGRMPAAAREDSVEVLPEALRQIRHLFEPKAAPLYDDARTVRQLHEWLDQTDGRREPDSSVTNRYDSAYFALKMYEREFGTTFDTSDIRIPGVYDARYPVPRPTVTFDANHLLSWIFIKEYRQIKRCRAAQGQLLPTGRRDLFYNDLPLSTRLRYAEMNATQEAPSHPSSDERPREEFDF